MAHTVWWLTRRGRFELRRHDEAELGPGDARIRFSYVGICGSDLSKFEGRRRLRYPVTMGHEFVATVEAVGEAVAGVSAGQVVTSDLNLRCGACDQCRARRSHPVRSRPDRPVLEPGPGVCSRHRKHLSAACSRSRRAALLPRRAAVVRSSCQGLGQSGPLGPRPHRRGRRPRALPRVCPGLRPRLASVRCRRRQRGPVGAAGMPDKRGGGDDPARGRPL